MATRNIVPRADGEGSLGTSAKKWGNIYADNGHIAGRNIAEDGAKLDEQATAIEQIRVSVGTPLVANSVLDMTDTDKIYVYTGNETGYTKGDWYYWNGSAWVSGGVYNSTAFETDKTLTIEGAAADAKAAGDWLRDIAVPVTALPEIPETAFANEYMKVVVDKDNRVLYGVKRDGTFTWAKGIPQHVIDACNPTIENPEYLYVMLDTEGHVILGVKRDGTFTWQKGVPKHLLDKINELAAPTIDNDEYMYVMLDSEGHVLFGVKRDGSFDWQKGLPKPVREKLEEVAQTVIDSEEFVQLTIDEKGVPIEGVRSTGEKLVFSPLSVYDLRVKGDIQLSQKAISKLISLVSIPDKSEDYIPDVIKVKPNMSFDINYCSLVPYYENQYSCYASQYVNTWAQSWKEFCRILPITESKSIGIKTNDGINIKSKAVAINLVQNPGGAKRILAIGDSWTRAGYWMQQIETLDSDVTFFGTVTSNAGVACEGYGGRYPRWFVTSEDSPFVFNGDFNFSRYMSLHSGYNLTHVIILLGQNDNESSESAKYMQILVDGIKAYNSGLKVIVCTTPPRSSYPSWAWLTTSAEQDRVHFHLSLSKEYERLENVDEIAYTHFVLHPFFDFPHRTRVFNEVTGETENYVTDPIHPSLAGYKRLGNVIFNYIL